MKKRILLFLILFLLLTAFFSYGKFFYYDSSIRTGDSLEPPSAAHFLGTDNLGVDIYAQISSGFFQSMAVGLGAAAVSLLLGGVFGISSGYYGGKWDFFVSFLINLFLSVPQLPIMILIGAFWGQSLRNIVIVVALFSWAPIAKILRAEAIRLKNIGYIRLARLYGGKFFYLFRKHMMLETFPLLLVNSLFVISKAIVQESSLAYLGLSDPTTRSWGLMINKANGFRGIFMTDFWKWWLMAPLFSLLITVLLIRFFSRECERSIMRGK
jgi:peptide/nickel transport system permease protein